MRVGFLLFFWYNVVVKYIIIKAILFSCVIEQRVKISLTKWCKKGEFMKKRKQVLSSIVLSLILFVQVLSGCGNSANNSIQSNSTVATQ